MFHNTRCFSLYFLYDVTPSAAEKVVGKAVITSIYTDCKQGRRLGKHWVSVVISHLKYFFVCITFVMILKSFY